MARQSKFGAVLNADLCACALRRALQDLLSLAQGPFGAWQQQEQIPPPPQPFKPQHCNQMLQTTGAAKLNLLAGVCGLMGDDDQPAAVADISQQQGAMAGVMGACNADMVGWS